MMQSERAALSSRKWALGPEFDGCWTLVDLALVCWANCNERQEQLAYQMMESMLAGGEIVEVKVRPGYARMFRFEKLQEKN